MRELFFKTLKELAESRDDLFILTGDLGFKLFDDFKAVKPERFFDIGVAEANMAGIAAGLALSGKNVYCYSIVPFLIMRAYEQIRVDIAYHNLNVKLIGVGGGLTYGGEGFTHCGLEDFTLMRALPHMTIVVPCDDVEAKILSRLSYHHQGPLYIRLDKNKNNVVHKEEPEFQIGKGMVLREGRNIAFFAIGNMVEVARQVADRLSHKGLWVSLVNMHTLKPLDSDLIKRISSTHEIIYSLEEHHESGGLGTAIAEILAETRYDGLFRRIGIPTIMSGHVGSAAYLREQYGLTADKVHQKVINEIKRRLWE